MKKISFMLFALLIPAVALNAGEVQYINGIRYSLNRIVGGNWAEVVRSNNYKGDIIIPEKVELRGESYTVTKIEKYAFSNCTEVTSVSIPQTVTSLGVHMFENCTNLTSVSFLNDHATINDYMFAGCTGLTSLDFLTSMSEIRIGGYAFKGCTGLTSVTFTSTIISVAKTAFADCDNLGSFIFHCKNTFSCASGLTGLKEIIFGEEVRTVDDEAFKNCTGLTSIQLPDSITTIGAEAFYGCEGLTHIVVPKGVKSIGKNAFSGCPNLTKATFHCQEASGFYENTYLKEVVLGDGVVSVNGNGFTKCTALESAYLSEGVKSIGMYSFDGCTSLTSVTIPSSLSSIGDYAFRDCEALTGVYISDLAAWNNISFGSNLACPLYFAKHLYLNGEELVNLRIPEEITSLNYYTFRNCENLKSVYIPSSVTSIEKGAFMGCTGIEEVEFHCKTIESWFYGISSLHKITIGDEVTSIGDYAFYNCSDIDSVAIPNSVESVGDYAFYGCNEIVMVKVDCKDISSWFKGKESIKELVLGDHVTSLGSCAFQNCIGLSSVTIPASAKNIGRQAFEGCTNLKEVILSEGVENLESYCFKDCVSLESIDLPSSMKTVGNNTFQNCKSLTSFVIPNTLEELGLAFSGCDGISSVTFHCEIIGHWFSYKKNLKEIYLGPEVEIICDNAFKQCTGLTSVAIPNHIKSIGKDSFAGCLGLISVDLHCDTIDSWFSGLSKIQEVTLGSEVKYIGEYAFSGCKSLTSIIIPESVSGIGARAFKDCTSLASVNIPERVESINSCTFWDCKSLTTIEIPESVKRIESMAFYGTGLISVKIPSGINIIEPCVFMNCSELSDVVFSADIERIEESAFNGCKSLTHIPVSDVLTSIGKEAFAKSGLKSFTFPTTLTNVGEDPFYKCDSLTSVVFHCKYVDNWFRNFINLKEVVFGEEVETITDEAFGWCKGLTTITIPKNVSSISESSFSNCTGLIKATFLCKKVGNWLYSTGVEEVVLGDEVETIADRAFSNCSYLTSIIIPQSVKSIGSEAFYNCTRLASVIIPGSVNSIGSQAFYNCRALSSVSLEDGITSIGEAAFQYCITLGSVAIPNSVSTIGKDMFAGCSNISLVSIPNSVTSIGAGAFIGCKSLMSIQIPNSVTSIGKDAFAYCSSLMALSIPESVKTIEAGAFYGCTNLTSVIIKNGEMSIGNSTFYNCESLMSVVFHCENISLKMHNSDMRNYVKEIIIGNEVKTVGNGVYGVFSGFKEATSVTIGRNVSYIGKGAFNYCSHLSEIYCKSKNVPVMESDVFYPNAGDQITLYVPASSINTYHETIPWSNFKEILPLPYEQDYGDDDEQASQVVKIVGYISGDIKSISKDDIDYNYDNIINVADIVAYINSQEGSSDNESTTEQESFDWQTDENGHLIVPNQCPDNNHPHLIDLGLPSGTKWACCNVGASQPNGHGGYYAWGELSEKDEYNWLTYQYTSNTDPYYLSLGDNIAGTQYDVAHSLWGDLWQMPTKEQFQELREQCMVYDWSTMDNVHGVMFVFVNGKVLFLPASGYKSFDSLSAYDHGAYWVSDAFNDSHAQGFGFVEGCNYFNNDFRFDGHTVRAVAK